MSEKHIMLIAIGITIIAPIIIYLVLIGGNE